MSASSHSAPTALWAWFATRAAQIVLVSATLAFIAATTLAAIGSIPWLVLPVTLDGGTAIDAGPGLQIALAFFLVTLCGFLPASERVMRLEMSHRHFHASMEDVAHAYYLAHSADRQGVFRLTAEFDAVRERFSFLRNHPDLGTLEPEILELAAQMSHVGRDLAHVYSDEKVAAARGLLAQRGDQASRIEQDVIRAMRVTQELSTRLVDVENREERANDGIARLKIELDAILPRLALATEATDWSETDETAAPDDEEAQRDLRSMAQPAIAVVRG